MGVSRRIPFQSSEVPDLGEERDIRVVGHGLRLERRCDCMKPDD